MPISVASGSKALSLTARASSPSAWLGPQPWQPVLGTVSHFPVHPRYQLVAASQGGGEPLAPVLSQLGRFSAPRTGQVPAPWRVSQLLPSHLSGSSALCKCRKSVSAKAGSRQQPLGVRRCWARRRACAGAAHTRGTATCEPTRPPLRAQPGSVPTERVHVGWEGDGEVSLNACCSPCALPTHGGAASPRAAACRASPPDICACRTDGPQIPSGGCVPPAEDTGSLRHLWHYWPSLALSGRSGETQTY